MMRPASSVQNVSRSGRATGRSTQQKLPNDLQCIKCGLWFTKGPSMNAHNRANANKAICD